MKPTAATSLSDHLTALGEPIRLRILRLVEREELSVGEVARVVQLPQSTVSRHLKVLLDSGWVTRRSDGPATLFRLVSDDLPEGCRGIWVAVREQLSRDRLTPEVREDEQRLAAVLLERREDSRAYFGRVAGQWDEVRNELFGTRFGPLALLGLLPESWTVADLGCGTGNAAELLAPLVRRVVAVDQSAPMLNAARKRLERFENVEYVEGELTNLPLEPGSTDAAVCLLVLHHVADPASAMAEMARILRPGGHLLIADMVHHDRAEYRHTMGHRWLGFSEAAVKAHFHAAGLEQATYRRLPSDTVAKGPDLFVATGRVPQIAKSDPSGPMKS